MWQLRLTIRPRWICVICQMSPGKQDVFKDVNWEHQHHRRFTKCAKIYPPDAAKARKWLKYSHIYEACHLQSLAPSAFSINNQKTDIVIHKNQLESGQNQWIRPVTEIYWNKTAGLTGYKINDTLYSLIR